MANEVAVAAPGGAAAPSLIEGLWRRQLPHYPNNSRRAVYLGIVVLVTIVLYY